MITFITSFYAAVLGLLFFALSVQTIRARRQLQIAIGDRGDSQMLRAMRVHANFAEYVPLTLLLLFIFEFEGGSAVLVHVLGVTLVLGRVAHAYGVSRSPEDFRYRAAGMGLTFAALVGASLCLLAAFVWQLLGGG